MTHQSSSFCAGTVAIVYPIQPKTASKAAIAARTVSSRINMPKPVLSKR